MKTNLLSFLRLHFGLFLPRYEQVVTTYIASIFTEVSPVRVANFHVDDYFQPYGDWYISHMDERFERIV